MAKERKYPDRYIFRIETSDDEVRIERVLATWSGFGVYKAGRFCTMGPREVEARTSLKYVLELALDLEHSALENAEKVKLHNANELQRVYHALKVAGIEHAFDLAHRFDHREKDDEEIREIKNRIATMEMMLTMMRPTVTVTAADMADVVTGLADVIRGDV